MGCGASQSPEAGAKDPLKSKATTAETGKRLLEEYSVGATLGEGAFGVVSNCTKRSTGEVFAVKMVDKVETPVEAIKREADMLQMMDHPNIVKFHGVFYERCFVCIVMDKYSGGDLVEGLQKHLREKGQINCHDVVHVAKQMASSIQYLHKKMVVHRDIKGDNYLMERKDIVDSKNRIVLTDFGTAVQIQPDERLNALVGTKIFWSPEFYNKDYGLKVDVWAQGVIMYGLVSGRFPFKDQQDVQNKEVKIPKRVHPVCEDFIKKQLEKVESARPSSDQVMEHQWLKTDGMKGVAMANDGRDDGDDNAGKDALRGENVNEGVKERRQELISRLNQEHDVRGKGDVKKKRATHHLQKTFVLTDKMSPGAKFAYEWWSNDKALRAGLLELNASGKTGTIGPEAKDLDLNVFKNMLEDHNIDPNLFGVGKAKTLRQLAQEVHSGACRLMLDGSGFKKLVRVVDVVLFRLSCAPPDKSKPQARLLVETEEKFADGRKRETNRLPGTKKEPHENAKQTGERILREYLNISVDMVEFDLNSISSFEEETESPSYPGVRTVYRKEIVEAFVKETDKNALAKVGLPTFTAWSATDTKEGNTKTFQWMTEEMATAKKVKWKPEGAEAVSALVKPPIGLSEEQLTEQLTAAGVDITKYGQSGKTKSLKDLSAELIRGEAALVKGAEGQLLRVVDVVLMVIRNPANQEVLVQTAHIKQDGTQTALNRLPGAKCRPDENQFLSARRILKRQLEMEQNDVQLLQNVVVVEEDKPTDFYPGLKTIYRKRLINAEIAPPGPSG